MFCAFGGTETRFRRSGSLHELELRRGPLSFGVDAGLSCDPFLTRHRDIVVEKLREFGPDLVHITGPGDVSVLGLLAARLAGVPIVASWHTNLHEYSQRRVESTLSYLPDAARSFVSGRAYNGTLWAVTNFYRLAHFVAAPNQDAVDLLVSRTKRPAFLMAHGVNTEMFTPARRKRSDARFCIGYVGRLTPEKNVRALAELERRLLSLGETDFRILLVGEGSERDWLRSHMKTADTVGVLRGDALADAFASMDAFVFPSLTDTFGLVILEAMSSGVPVILNSETGSHAGVRDGIDGFLGCDFVSGVRTLMHCPATRFRMAAAARASACDRAWPGVFEDLHRIYHDGLDAQETRRRMPTRRFGPPATNGAAAAH